MPIVGKYFPSQRSQEKVFLLLRRHWFTYIPFLAIALIMAIPLFILLGFWVTTPEVFTPVSINIAILASSVWILFIIALLLYGFIDYYLDVYIVTNERIVDVAQDGFFKRSISELYLREVQDVSAKVSGFFPTLMHYGEITIQTAGERPNFIFKNVPNPYRISKTIVDLHEAAVEGAIDSERSNVSPKIAAKIVEDDEIPSDFKIDLNTASTARKRTKDYIRGEKLIETQLAQEVSENINNQKSDDLIKNISSEPKNKKISNTDDETSGQNLNNTKKLTKKGKSAGEMHENEEVDL